MSERNISATLKTSLLDNDAFIYYHLIKFEKPQPSLADGSVAKKAEYYSYITDAPFNYDWNDGSVDAEGNANGTQTYVANKVLNVGNIQETTEARATAMSVRLSTIALGTSITESITCTTTYLDTPLDLVATGFREGDKVLLSGGLNDGRYVRFDRFTSEGSSALANSRVYFTVVDNGSALSSDTDSYAFSLESEELKALTRTKSGSAQYASYINREVFIYKVHANPTTGDIIGTPFLLFRGIISQGSLDEKPDGESSITWGLTSHWGDFVRVQGRLTSDAAHRALDISGRSDATALVRDEYATDFGFSHAEQSINVLATYQAQEVRYRNRRASGFSGLIGGKKIEEYYVTVDRDVDLRFDLTARYLPIVYGVQRVNNIPVFADVQADNPAEFYVVFALCEGEIGGILDIYVDGNSSVCLDALDAGVRDPDVAGDVESVDVVCSGRADTGDVLGGGTYRAGTYPGMGYNINRQRPYRVRDGVVFGYEIPDFNIGVGSNSTNPSGITHEKTYSFNTPIDARFVIHTGKSDQIADLKLVQLASNNNFKIQADYFDGEPTDYWSTSHRLLDTAYVQAHFTLSEGEESIPEYEFIVKGKYIDCYNYDGSFKIYSGTHADYDIGDVVNLSVDGNGGSHSNVTIIDKWTMYDANGNADVRFRWATNYPNSGDTLVDLGTTGDTITMTATAKSTIVMRTWNHVGASGTASNGPTGTLSNVSYTGPTTATLTVDISGAAFNTALAAAGANNAYIALVDEPNVSYLVKSWNGSTATLTPHSGAAAELEAQVPSGSADVFISNLVNGVTSAAGNTIEISRVIDNSLFKKTKTVVSSSSTYTFTKEPFTSEFLPQAGDAYTVYTGEDRRVSINPAVQLLDYVTSKRYGKGLSLEDDINLDTWLEAGRLCDDRSKITVATTGQPAVGAVYEINRPDGSLIFQGTVSDVNGPYNTSFYEVEFDNIIGKLGYKWTSGRVFKVGDILWYDGLVKVSDRNSTIPSGDISGLTTANVILSKLSGTGPTTLTVNTADVAIEGTNPIVRSWVAADAEFSGYGYSLHDSDDVKYWKYLGWDEPEQRYVTRHQMNQVISTSAPIFDNINSMLRQFNGILRYSNGKYELDIKTASPGSFTPGVDSFSEDDIIGSIKISDTGQKNSFNSMTANILDPQNKFGSRSISFFDSTYLKQDKGIPKQGNFAMPGISNYYAARTNIIQYLKESRYGLTITFSVGPSGYLTRPGNIISLNYSRFEWVDKEFRVSTISLAPDGLVTITAEEHNDEAFLVDYIDRDISYNPGTKSTNTLTPPTNLIASQDLPGMIQLTWTNSVEYDPLKFNIEIWGCEAEQLSNGEYILDSQNDPTGNEFANAVFLDFANGDDWTHVGLGDAPATEQHHIWFYWIRYSRTPSNFNTKYSTYEPVKTGPGAIGKALSDVLESGRRISIESDTYVWEYDGTGQLAGSLSASQATVTAHAYGTIGTPYYQFFVYASDGTLLETSPAEPGVSNEYIYTPPEFIDGSARSMPESVLVELREYASTDPIRASDRLNFNGVSSSSDAIYISIPNPTHIIPYDWADQTTDYTGSGTTITVYEGNDVLTAVSTVDLDPGQFKVAVSSNTNITPGSITPSSSAQFMDVDDHSAMTADVASIEYTITVQRLNGSEITFLRTQSFAKVSQNRPGRVAYLTASDYSVVYDETDSNPSYTGTPPNINLTYDSEGFLSPQYRLTIDGNVGTWGAGTTGVYAVPSTKAGTSAQLVLEVREGASGTEYATDSASIIFVSQSESGLSGVLSNENHTVAADQVGENYDLTGSGGTYEVFSGGQDVTLSCTFDIVGGDPPAGGSVSKTQNGLTMSINQTTGAYTLSGGSWSTVFETFDLTADYGGTIITKRYTISKAIAGASGRAVFLIASDYSVVYDENNTNPSYTGSPSLGEIDLTYTSFGYISPEYRLTIDGTPDPLGFTTTTTGAYAVPSNKTGTSAQLVLEARENAADSDYTSDSASIIFITQGVSGLSAVLTNENHTVPTLPDGTGYSLTGSDGTMEVFNGGQDVTLSSTFSITGGTDNGTNWTKVQNGLTLTMQETTGVYSLSGGSWDTDIETFDLIADYNGTTITKRYTISKAVAGVDGVTLSLVADATLIRYDEAGENPDPAGVVTLTASSDGLVSPLYRFSASFIPTGGTLTNQTWSTSNTATWTIPTTAFTFTPQVSYLTVEVSETGSVVAATDRLSIEAAADGYGAITVEITNPTQALTQVGDILSYDNSDTYIILWEGARQLDYRISGASLSTSVGAINKWKIVQISYGGGLAGNPTHTSATIIDNITDGVDYPDVLDACYVNELGGGLNPYYWTDPDLYSGWIEYTIEYRRLKQTTEGPFYITARQYLSRQVANTDGYTAFLSNASAQVPTGPAPLYDGANFSNTDTRVYVYKGGLPVSVDQTDPYGPNTWRIIAGQGDIVRIGSTITVTDAVQSYYTTGSPNYAVIGDIDADNAYDGPSGNAWTDPDGFAQRSITVTVRDADGVTDHRIPVIQNFTRITGGAAGADGADGVTGSDGSVITVIPEHMSVSCDGVGYFFDWSSSSGLLPPWAEILAWKGDESVLDTDVTISGTGTGWTTQPTNDWIYKQTSNLYCVIYYRGSSKGKIYFYSATNDSLYSSQNTPFGTGRDWSWIADDTSFSFQTYSAATGTLYWTVWMHKNYGTSIRPADTPAGLYETGFAISAGWAGLRVSYNGNLYTDHQNTVWPGGAQINTLQGVWKYYSTYVNSSSFECKVSVDPSGDSFETGSSGLGWVNLVGDAFWYINTGAGVEKRVSGSLMIRHVATEAVVATIPFAIARSSAV